MIRFISFLAERIKQSHFIIGMASTKEIRIKETEKIKLKYVSQIFMDGAKPILSLQKDDTTNNETKIF
jgi:hypothetical protein